MELDKKDSFFIGTFVKTIGYDGGLLLAFDVDQPERYTNLKHVFVEEKEILVHYEVTSIDINKNRSANIVLAGVDSEDMAKGFLKRLVFLPLTELPPLTDNTFYHHEIFGYTVIHAGTKEEIGTAKGVMELPHQKLLEVDRGGKEILLPITPEFYVGIDREKKILYFDPPDGLIDVFLNK
jgi:16S rRNA processing protein RimM